MCGIAGIFLAVDAADPRRLGAIETMTASLRHRGPDGHGLWHDPEAGIAFGHRRLSIIDLSELGAQPMVSPSGRFTMTYNGEVYNHHELRFDLEARGVSFRGHSDTEVMLAAFEAYGIEASLSKFAGMFAFAVWDAKHRILHLARDRVGKKPLYVAVIRGGLLFASEPKAFLHHPDFAAEVDPLAEAMMLRRGWVPEDCCIWRGVFKLPPGTSLSLSAKDLEAADTERLRGKAVPWWSLHDVAAAGLAQQIEKPLPDMVDDLDELLRLAVRQRMVADVPVGAFLSGGIDSSIVVALMQAEATTPVRTYSIGFAGTHYNEAPHAALVADHLGTEHVEFDFTASDARDIIPDLPQAWDEPFADESQVPTLLLARLARQEVTVVLTGDGGDECFAGYTRHVMQKRLAPAFHIPHPLRAGVASAVSMLSESSWERLVARLGVPERWTHTLRGENLQKLTRALSAPDEQGFYESLLGSGATPVDFAPRGDSSESGPQLPGAVNRMIYRDMTTYLPGDILVKTDRATMAASLEARCPLLDHRLIEFVWRLPEAAKISGGTGKFILRQLLERYVPSEIHDRPKHGFNVPIGDWLRGPLQDWAADLLFSRDSTGHGLIDAADVERCWQQHQNRKRDNGRQLWAMLMLLAWRKANTGRRQPIVRTETGHNKWELAPYPG